MSMNKIVYPSFGGFPRVIDDHVTDRTSYYLTVADRAGIEKLLRNRATRHAANPTILNGLLRHKLRSARGAPEPAPSNLVVAGSQVTYMISGEGARTAELCLQAMPLPGRILVASLLGATLIGMQTLQKSPLLRDDGSIDTVVVLEVVPPPKQTAA
jgi:hypothetical protein